MRRSAAYYKTVSSFKIKGTASAMVPGSSWRASYDVEIEGAQPAFLPLSSGGSSMKVTSIIGNFRETLAVPGATDPMPAIGLTVREFGDGRDLIDHLIDARKIGTESIPMQGHTYSCEIIDAVYDLSPEFKPHSQVEHRRISIDPTTLWVLRETRPDEKLGEWVGTVTSITINEPPSAAMIAESVRDGTAPKDRPEWVGRTVPALTLPQLSGPAVNLVDLRGKPVFLDFWGSYCRPCTRFTLAAQEYAKRYESSGLTVLTVTQDTAEDAKLWTSYNHVTLPVLLDRDGNAFKAFDISGVPIAILIDAQGKIVHFWMGVDNPATIEAVLDANLRGHAHSGR
jgi:peroxiredoxin